MRDEINKKDIKGKAFILHFTKGLISCLDYFNYLSIDTLLLSPFQPSTMLNSSCTITDYNGIDCRYGTVANFDNFMAQAKLRNLNILMELVVHHTSDKHIWFLESVARKDPYTEYYVWANPRYMSCHILPPNDWLNSFGRSAWEYSEVRKQFYLHQLLPEQPDLNWRNPKVREEIKKVIWFWLEKGIDGFQIDPPWRYFNDKISSYNPSLTNYQINNAKSNAEISNEVQHVNKNVGCKIVDTNQSPLRSRELEGGAVCGNDVQPLSEKKEMGNSNEVQSQNQKLSIQDSEICPTDKKIERESVADDMIRAKYPWFLGNIFEDVPFTAIKVRFPSQELEDEPDDFSPCNLRNKPTYLTKYPTYTFPSSVGECPTNAENNIFDTKMQTASKTANLENESASKQIQDKAIERKNESLYKDWNLFLDDIPQRELKNNLSFFREWRAVLDEYELKTGKDKIILTKTDLPLSDLVAYFGNSKRLVDIPFNEQLLSITTLSTAIDLQNAIKRWSDIVPNGKCSNWILGDQEGRRFSSRVGSELAVGLHIVVALLPGILYSYYGDELGMRDFSVSSETSAGKVASRYKTVKISTAALKRPMQWNDDKLAGFTKSKDPSLSLHKQFSATNVKQLRLSPYSILNIYSRLLQLRKEPAFKYGSLEFPFVDGSIFSMIRSVPSKRSYLIVLNMGNCLNVVDFSSTSQYLPEIGYLELSNNSKYYEHRLGRYQNLSADYVSQKYLKAVRLCDTTVILYKIHLNNIMLLPKEAMVISFTPENIVT